MSTGAECRFTEVEPGRWTYWLQDYPYGETEDGQTFGPFNSYRDAHDHLEDYHANPGGSMTKVHKNHVHEPSRGGWVNAGVTVSIDVESLGPDPAPSDVIAFIQTLPVDHPAFRVYPGRPKMSDDVIVCLACGEKLEAKS